MKTGKQNKKLGLPEVVSIAVGTMIGASIFSIFGLGVGMAGKHLPEALILSGVFALMVAYSYATMGKKVVSNAGPIAFILKGIGDNLLTGTLSLLLWLTFVVSIALFAKGFAGYFLPLAHIPPTPFSKGMTEVGLIAAFTGLNFFGSKSVGRAELFIVMIKLSILVLFIVLGFISMKSNLISPTFSASGAYGMLHASVIFFLSYMGFGLIVNTSENMKNPQKNIPRAMYISVGIVLVIYVGVAVAAIGNLSVPELLKAKDNALAMAAKPFIGVFGFILISVGALFSISSAMNATIYGGANIAYALAKDGELPEFFERKVWFKSTEGLFSTTALGALFALFFDIGAIASIISAIYTIIYIFVLISHYRLIREVGGNKLLVLFNLCVIIMVFLTLMYFQWKSETNAFWGTLITIAGALFIELLLRIVKKRGFTKTIMNLKKNDGSAIMT